MGRQIRVFLTQADIRELEDVLVTEDVLILHDRSRGPFPKIVDSTDLVEGRHRHIFFYLTRKTDLESVRTDEVKTQGYWSIDSLRSPVVEFSLSNFDGEVFRPGRLYYNDSYYDSSGKVATKTGGFSAWAKKLLSNAKSSLIYNAKLGAYLGREAVEVYNTGANFQGF